MHATQFSPHGLEDEIPHYPVLYQETIQFMKPRSGGYYVDGTLGAGGHAFGILEASSPDGKLIGLDVDPQALILAESRLSPFIGRYTIRRMSYTNFMESMQELGWVGVDGILLDLGVSSMQLDTVERGFSFQTDAPLDMRFDPDNPRNAEDLVNDLSESELANLIYLYGEERYSRRVSKAIIQARPLKTTQQLASVIKQAIGSKYSGSRLHPATRTFQALRIAVNGELDAIGKVLPQAIHTLFPGGRLVVIAFHSLEDRLVKEFFRKESTDCLCPSQQPICTCGHKASVQVITRHPIQPGEAEIASNIRSRSARLRVVQKLPEF